MLDQTVVLDAHGIWAALSAFRSGYPGVPTKIFEGNLISRVAGRPVKVGELIQELLSVVDDCRDLHYCYYTEFARHLYVNLAQILSALLKRDPSDFYGLVPNRSGVYLRMTETPLPQVGSNAYSV